MAALKLSRRHRSERGAVLVEAAIALPLLLLVVLGIIDFGRLFQRYEVLTNAAREGARIAVLPVGYSTTEVKARVLQYIAAGGLNPTDATPGDPTSEPKVLSPGVCVTVTTVTVTYPHTYSFVGGIVKFFGGTGFGTTQLTATAAMRSEGPAIACP
jgi:Flp pilus assembly protein TadG